MFNLEKKLVLGNAVAWQLVSHDHARHVIKALQQPPEKAFGCFGMLPRLNEDIEHDAILIHGVPKIVQHALDPDKHLRYHLSPGRGGRRRRWLAKAWPGILQSCSKQAASPLNPCNSLEVVRHCHRKHHFPRSGFVLRPQRAHYRR